MGSTTSYRKVAFTWDEPQPPVDVPDRLVFRPVENLDDRSRFLGAVREVLVGSLDVGDQHAVATRGVERAARSYLQPDPVFRYEPGWWHLAFDRRGQLVGFTQPVTYRDSDRDGLPEATIHYIGVLPAQRGHGYVDDLLRHATRTLQGVGVWRVYADTGVLNVPMRRAFERVGYRRGSEHDVPLTLLRG